jgi:signal transduction histidine kinase
MSLFDKIKPAFWDESKPSKGSDERLFDYAGIWKHAVIGTSAIVLLPIIFLFLIDYYEHKKGLKREIMRPIYYFVTNSQRSLSSFLSERKAVLRFIAEDNHLEEFSDQKRLEQTLANLRTAFGDFADLGVIDSNGIQRAYAGPGDLQGEDYKVQRWYKEVNEHGVYVSEVYPGFDGSPHFVIALKHQKDTGHSFILSAGFDGKTLGNLTRSLAFMPSFDAFIVNTDGVLQTTSRSYGNVFEKFTLPIASASSIPEVQELEDPSGRSIILGSAVIEDTPFRFVTVAPREALTGGLFSQGKRLIVILIISMVCVLIVIMGVVTRLVGRIYEADRKRVEVLHNIQYTNKMASIGRLAAGVGHEINNPLAVINEKVGLLKDLISLEKDFPRSKFVEIVDSVLSSVERCSTITHRLLGFARHWEVQFETIHLDQVINGVLVFFGRESEYRSITVDLVVQEGLPPIESDPGQIEQVFFNIINNAFAAVEEGGRIHIELLTEEPDMVSVRIVDDGCGISEENLTHIFDPFFSTKGEEGSGLGLSITYGIMQKLGGKLDVKSKKGEGSTFTVTLPTKGKESTSNDKEEGIEGFAGG